jgi:Tfp pilus assembly protein PilF
LISRRRHSRVRRVLAAALLASGLLTVADVTAAAQSAAVTDARRLRDKGDLDAAVRALQRRLKVAPDDREALRLLAQTLYWLKDSAGARKIYEQALNRDPRDIPLRVEYAQMLAETGDRRAARRILTAAPDVERSAPATALLGTLAYWDGDFVTAARLFEQTLRLDASHAEARRQLQEIRAAAASWLRLSPAVAHDDQPIDRRTAELEAGMWLTPLTPVRIRFSGSQHVGGATTRRAWSVEAELRHYLAGARLDLEAAGGFVRRRVGGEDDPEWIGRGVIGFRLPNQLTLRGRVERVPYFATIASLRSRILVDSAAAELHWNSGRGWVGQAAIARQTYPDDNTTAVRYAWLLAPIVRQPHVDLQAGYAVAYEHAEVSRFVPAANAAPDPVTFAIAGNYDPYYTPARVMRHSAAAALRVRASPRVTVRLNGSYAFRATEDAPVLFSVNGGVDRFFFEREFHPWEGRGSVEIAATPRTAVAVTAEAGRGAFYRSRSAAVQLTYRFLPRLLEATP